MLVRAGAQLHAKARTFGIDLEAAERAGTLELLIIPPHVLDADLVAWRIRERIEARHVRRLVIDSATELQSGLTSPERATMFLASLAAYLRSEGVTTYMTVDVPTIVGPELSFSGNPLLVFAENLLLLRYAELVGELTACLPCSRCASRTSTARCASTRLRTGRGSRSPGWRRALRAS
jgi:KaiC/GvpD/RAD55 family RecA-like ATPase